MLRDGYRPAPNYVPELVENRLPSVFRNSSRHREYAADTYRSEVKRKVGKSVDYPSNPSFLMPVKTPQIKRETFTFLMAVGRGSYGKVWKAVHRKSGAVYAIKEMSRSQ